MKFERPIFSHFWHFLQPMSPASLFQLSGELSDIRDLGKMTFRARFCLIKSVAAIITTATASIATAVIGTDETKLQTPIAEIMLRRHRFHRLLLLFYFCSRYYSFRRCRPDSSVKALFLPITSVNVRPFDVGAFEVRENN